MEEKNQRFRQEPRRRRSCGCGCCAGCLGAFVLILVVLAVLGVFFYNDIRSAFNGFQQTISQENLRQQPVNLAAGDPFSVLLLGIDSGDFERTDQGRSDTIMLSSVNPHNNQTTILSIPRDTRVYINEVGYEDKLNHAYAYGGAGAAVNAVQSLLNVPIDYYITVDMAGLQQLIDAIGGIQLTPSIDTYQDGYQFIAGQTLIVDGAGALAYVRNRQDDPRGDYGRQARQREVVLATLNAVGSIDSLINYRPLLGTLEQAVTTNLSFEQLMTFFQNYRNVADSVIEEQLNGEGVTIDNIYYEVIPEAELNRVQQLLRGELELS